MRYEFSYLFIDLPDIGLSNFDQPAAQGGSVFRRGRGTSSITMY